MSPSKEDLFAVREQHPLKQGLRRQSRNSSIYEVAVREQHPLKQGLRHCVTDTSL